ncbi:MAG: type III secretion system stator protein SctL [Verrucomicrobiales bacterium]|nr:type III secretion system stator protein SctL [Verrucomicrobiales bacterium]
MHFLKLEHTHLYPDQKVIEAEEFSVFREAEQILAQAKLESEKILERARDTFEEERERGYIAGFEEGKAEISEHLVRTVQKSARYLNDIELSMVDVVLASVRTIAEGFSDREKIRPVVNRLISQAKKQDQVTLWVSREDFESQRADLRGLHQRHPDIGSIKVEMRPDLKIGECILETEVGKIESTLDAHLETIRTALINNLNEGN